MTTEVISFSTQDKLVLNGLWFGGSRAKTVFIFVHGLTSSCFSNHALLEPLMNESTAALYFNNRGCGKISKFKKIDKRKASGSRSVFIGEAHEIFTDCIHDIEGAVRLARSRGAQKIFLVGHSTGCQKSVYYLSQKGKQKNIAGVILLSPVSDYASAHTFFPAESLKKAQTIAEELVRAGKSHKLLPEEIWPSLHDAQRFLSLYTPESKEEVFSYAQPEKPTKTYKSIKIPQLVIFGDEDVFIDRPLTHIIEWFKRNSRKITTTIRTIPRGDHSFSGEEPSIARHINQWSHALPDFS